MSADVEHPDATLAAMETPTAPTPAARPGSATGSNGESDAPPLPAAPPQAADAPRWQMAATGYLVLTAGFGLALATPHLPLRAGAGEDALIILSIAAMLAGAAAVVASFVLNLLRQL